MGKFIFKMCLMHYTYGIAEGYEVYWQQLYIVKNEQSPILKQLGLNPGQFTPITDFMNLIHLN